MLSLASVYLQVGYGAYFSLGDELADRVKEKFSVRFFTDLIVIYCQLYIFFWKIL